MKYILHLRMINHFIVFCKYSFGLTSRLHCSARTAGRILKHRKATDHLPGVVDDEISNTNFIFENWTKPVDHGKIATCQVEFSEVCYEW